MNPDAQNVACSYAEVLEFSRVHGEQLVSDGRGQRRSFLLSALGAWAVSPASMAAPDPVRSEQRPLQRVSIALAAPNSLYHLPLTLADKLGYFRQAGIAVEWSPQESGAKALAIALQGQVNVVASAFEHLFGLHQKGLNYQAFVQMGRTPQLSFGVATRLDVRSVMGLKGARVGVSSLQSSTHSMACHWLMQNGLLPEDVVFVEVGTSAGVVDALRTGTIDALCNPDPIMYGLEQRNEIRLLGEARTLMASRKLMGGSVPGSCLWARTDFLQKQPELTQALSDAVVHALKWLQTAGLTDILKTVPSTHWVGDRAIYLGAFEKLRESYALDGLFVTNDVTNAWHAYNRLPNRLGGARPALASTYNNSFALRSKNRFSA
jgi:NitT/TauT family transport system substrate-binding protein